MMSPLRHLAFHDAAGYPLSGRAQRRCTGREFVPILQKVQPFKKFHSFQILAAMLQSSGGLQSVGASESDT
jgi:hypothetical protein